MNWIERINNLELTITTGDGKVYKPLYKNASQSVAYNVENYEFIGQKGTYVEKEEQKGARFPIELYFQGLDHLDISKAFRESAADKREWIVEHPKYDRIVCKPSGLNFDDTKEGVTKINGTLWETLSTQEPQEQTNPEKEIELLKISIDELTLDDFVASVGTPESATISSATDSNSIFSNNYTNLPNTNEQTERLKDLVRQANADAQNIISTPDRWIRSAIDLINFPSDVALSVAGSINSLKTAAEQLKARLLGENKTADNEDLFYSQSNLLLSAGLSTASQGDYFKASDVLDSVDALNSLTLFINEAYEEEGIEQDSEIANSVDYMVNYTISELFNIAFEAKQERSLILEKDSNPVVLAHRFYGISDESLERFISENNITSNELLEVKKGRTLVWYV
jgi:hypothetical protein